LKTDPYIARHAMGKKVVGQALVAHDGFSARYDLNRLQGSSPVPRISSPDSRTIAS
jgi:hypothetical protein